MDLRSIYTTVLLLTFTETIEHGTGGGDDRQRTQYQGDDQLQIRVDGRVLGYVLIDLHGCHGAAHVRLQSRYPVLGDRKTRVIVRPRPDVVRGPRLKLAQRVRFLYLDKEERFFLIIFCNNNTIFFGQNCLYRGNFNEI